MTNVEKKVVDCANKVDWDFDKVRECIDNKSIGLSFDEYETLEGKYCDDKVKIIFDKFKFHYTYYSNNMETKNRKFKVGDKVRNITNKWNSAGYLGDSKSSVLGALGTVVEAKDSEEYYQVLKIEWDNGGFCGKDCSQVELVEEVKEEKLFKVTREQIKEIYNHVCSNYKDKIDKLLQSNLFDNEIELRESLVMQAHKDAGGITQKFWLEKYLPLPKKKKIELVSCLMMGCRKFNTEQIFKLKDFKDYELVQGDYGGVDIIKAKVRIDDSTIIFFGHWNEGVTED